MRPTLLAGLLAAGLPALPAGYNIIIAAGQSNMQGAAALLVGTDDVADTLGPAGAQLIKQWDTGKGNGSFHTIKAGQDPLPAPATGGINSGITTTVSQFARQYAAATGKKVLIVFVPVANTDLIGTVKQWQYTASPANPPTYSGNAIGVASASNLYSNFIYEANLAVTAAVAADSGSAVVGVLWCQGENDANQNVDSATYLAAMQAVIDGVRAQVTGATNAWFAILSMLPEAIWTEPLSYGNYPNFRPIHAQHKLAAASRARSAFIRGAFGYSDRAADITAGQTGAIHYRDRLGNVDLATRLLAALPTLRGKSTAAPIAAPAAPTIRSIAASSGQSIVIDLYRDFSQGNDDLVVEYRVTGAGSWTTYYAGTKGLFQTAERIHIGGLTASTSYDVQITDKNAAGSSASVTGTVSTTSDAVTTYTFETDTLSAAPAGATTYLGRMVVANSGLSGFGQSLVPSGASKGAGWDAVLEKIPHTQDRTVIWRHGNTHSADLQKARGGMILRAQQDKFCGGAFPGLFAGYYFAVDMQSAALVIYRCTPSGRTQVATGFSGGQADCLYKASAIGTLGGGGVVLTIQRSLNGGSSWTNTVTYTDTNAAGFDYGGVSYFVDASSTFPTEFYVDQISWS